jgi:hypothetical protein
MTSARRKARPKKAKPRIVYLPQIGQDGIFRSVPFTVRPHPFDPDYVIKEPLMKTKKRSQTKRNMQDATLKNIRALKKRMAALEKRSALLHDVTRRLCSSVLAIQRELKGPNGTRALCNTMRELHHLIRLGGKRYD